MRRATLLSLALFLTTSFITEAADPSLGLIMPRGAQRGTQAVLNFSGARLQDAEEIFFYSPGFEVSGIEAENANSIKVTVNIASDCRLGEHTAQVRTKSGISEYRTFFVGALPAVSEIEPNTQFDAPQAIEMNVTVAGVIENEDVDYYVVSATAGQRISAEVEGMRFGQTMFDPYVAILNSKRFELAAADDTPLVRQDAVASIVAPEDGQYVIEVREAAYGGSGACRYRLHVGTFPRPTAIYPAGGQMGQEIDVQYIGIPGGEITQKVTVPGGNIDDYGLFCQNDDGVAPSPNPFRTSEHGNAFEVEPNNSRAEATPVEFPMAFNGIIQEAGDIDFFRFKATKGQVWEVECFARRIRSGLDGVMNLYNASGGGIAGNDDSRGPDSYFRFQVPEDGEYVVRMTDHLGRGGEDFVYRIEFHPVKASLSLGIPRVARYSQDRQQICVPKGNRFATLVSASRANFGGGLILNDEGLPEGITMITRPMPDYMNVWPVVFEAAPDAALSGRLLDFVAQHVDPKQNISGGFRNRADFVISAPGQSLYSWKDVNRLPVAVIDEIPFTLEIVQPNVPIVRDGSMNLKVIATRKEGWDGQINVQFPFRPPGIGAAASVNIPAGQNEVLYPISANGGARIDKFPIYVIGSAENTGASWGASQMAELEIADRYLNITLQRAAVELGQETEVAAAVEVAKEFPGNARVELLGLPHKVTTEVMEINKDAKELVFKVRTGADSPAGNHKNIFCRVTVTENDEPVVHARVGGTELRIDKPLPPKKDEPAPAPMPKPEPTAGKKPEKPPEKRLTRLEKLRLEAKERAEGSGTEK